MSNNVQAVRSIIAVTVIILVGATNLITYSLTAIAATAGKRARRK